MIIAEFSHNHGGDMALLKRMVDHASAAGAQFAKIQTHFAEDLQAEWRQDFERVSKYQLSWDSHRQFVVWCEEAKITPMTSVYSFRHAEELWKAGVRDIKIGSAQAMNEDLIIKYKVAGFRVYVSTGGHDVRDLPRRAPHCWVHCNSVYPTSPYETNLARIYDLRRIFPSAQVGYSSHVDPTHKDWALPLKLASFLGASPIEVHFTLLPREETKDGKVSLDVAQLTELCQFEKLTWEEKQEHHEWFGTLVTTPKKEEAELIERYSRRFRT